MEDNEIKYRVISEINGVKHLNDIHLENFKYYICHKLGIEKTDYNFILIKEAVELYFKLQNSINIYGTQKEKTKSMDL